MTSKSWTAGVCVRVCMLLFFQSGSMTNAARKCKLYPFGEMMATARGWMIKCNWNRIYSTKYHNNIFWCPRSRPERKMWVYVPFDWFILFCMFSGMVLKASWWILCLIFIIFMDASFMDFNIFSFCIQGFNANNTVNFS